MGKKSQHANTGSSNKGSNALGSNNGANSASTSGGNGARATDTSSGQSSSRSTPSSSGQNFEFVLVTDAESRRQVRRHAMRQYMRQRRADGIARLGSSRVPVPSWSSRTPDSQQNGSLSPEENHDDSEEEKYMALSSPGREPTISNASEDPPSSASLVASHSRHGSMLISRSPQQSLAPLVTPGPGPRTDPFNSFPLSLKDDDQKLINHYVVTYPSMMYKMTGRAGLNTKNPIQVIFQSLAMKDKLAFQAMLAIAAKHRAGVEGKTENVQSLTHKMKALRLVNERIQSDVGSPDDGVIYAVATLAVIEKWSKDSSIERMHFQGLASMVRRRGGMRGLRASNKFLEQLLYWVDFSCAPKAIFGASMPWTGSIPDTLPENLQFLLPDLHLTLPYHGSKAYGQYEADILRACEDFLTFFRSLHLAEQELLHRRLGTPPLSVSSRKVVFSPSTPLYSVLTTLPDYDHGIRDVRFIDEYTCLACLLYLNVALYDYYVKGGNFDEYLGLLDQEIQQGGSGMNPPPSISAIMWWFLGNGGYAPGGANDDGERSWFVSRMLRVAKRLEWNRHGKIWDHLRAILIGFITTQQDCGLGWDDRGLIGKSEWISRQQAALDRRDLMWDEDEMRKEILGDLYSGPPVYTTTPQAEGSPAFLQPASWVQPE